MLEHVDTVVIGAGQAGLAVSRELGVHGVEHVILERSRVAQAWRDRWDSFTLVTPNWTMDLPGTPYAGPEPEGHVSRDEIIGYIENYRTTWAAPVQEGVTVTALRAARASGFELMTSLDRISADTVVVCTGAFQKPYRPPAGLLPPGVPVIDAIEYRNPAELPAGKVLVIGSGQTGCQLAEELFLAGRDVFLSCGRAPWLPRRLDDLDTVTWLHRVGFFDQPLSALPSPAGRLLANPQATGAAGGHDLHFRTLQRRRSARPSGRGRRAPRYVRRRPGRVGGLWRRALGRVASPPCQRTPDTGVRRARVANPRAVPLQPGYRGRPPRHWGGDLHHGLQTGLPMDRTPHLGCERLSDHRRGKEPPSRTVLLRRALHAGAAVGISVRSRTRRGDCGDIGRIVPSPETRLNTVPEQ